MFSFDFTKHINICPPYISHQIQLINLKVYSRKEIYDIHEGDDSNNEAFLIHLFQINDPISPDFWYFASIFTENHQEIKETPNLWNFLTSILFRLLIKFDYQFYKSYEQILINTENELLFINSHLIYPLIYSLPPLAIDTGFEILSHFTSAVSHIFNKPNITSSNSSTVKIANAILYGCFNIFNSTGQNISKIHFPILRLFLIYFSANLPLIGTNIITIEVIQNIHKMTSLFLHIPPNLMTINSFDITNQFLNCSSQFLDKFGAEKFANSNNHIIFEIGTNIIKMLSFISQSSLKSKMKISKEIHSKSIIMFILWVLDSFPLTDFKYQEDLHQNQSGIIPKETSIDSFKKDIHFNFIEDETFKDSTFFTNKIIDSNLADQISETNLIQTFNNENNNETTDCDSIEIDENNNNNNENKIEQVAVNTIDGKEIRLIYNGQYHFLMNLDDSSNEPFILSKYFKDEQTTLITAIRFFLDQMTNDKIDFINDFVSSYFTIIDQIINKDSNLYAKFQIIDHCMLLSFHFFMILLFSQFKSDQIFEIISSHPKGWPTIYNKIFYSPLINHWVDPTPYFQFCFDIRSAITKFTLRCFNLSNKENNTLFSTLHNFFYSVEPQIFDEAINIFTQLFKLKPIEFVEIASQTGIIEMLIFNSEKLQKLHIHLIKTNNQMEKFIEQTRIHLFTFFDLFLMECSSTEYFFKNEFYVKYLVSLLFEKSVTLFAIKLIQRGMLLSDTFEVFNAIHFLFQIALKKMNDMNWIKMLNLFLVNIRSPFILNRSTIMKSLINKEILLQISQIPDSVILLNPSFFHIQLSTESSDTFEIRQNLINKMEEEEEEKKEKNIENADYSGDIDCDIIDPNSEQVHLIKNVLFLIIILSRGSQPNSSYIASNEPYLSNISKALSRFKYGPEILNLLLELIFEKQMNVNDLPKKAEIQNHHALPFFFNSTKHLEIHGELMRYLSDVLSDSISNRLRTYQANIPNIIIDRITQFPSEPSVGSYLDRSLTESLHLFSVVSQYVFSVSTLYKCIRAFKPIKEGFQMWWTAQLISLFNIYVENSLESSPAAFFYLDGFQTFFDIPSFSASLISKGFTFVCRIQLDSNSSNSSSQSTLLYMESVTGFVFELLFVKMKLKVNFYSKKKNMNQTYKVKATTFSGNKWYDLIVTFSKSNMIIFMNGKQIFGLEMKYPFKEDVKYSIIANNRKRNSPLIANISCFYFLNDSINSWTALEFHSLPLDFVFGFSILEKLLDKNLPISLFDGRIESTLFIGANARMTNQSECLNFATRYSIGNATYKGCAFPFSASFIDVVGYSGGAKLFLPLFEQINSEIYGNEESQVNNTSFLHNLISLLATFFVHSSSIETEFVKDGGFHAISYLLTKINSKYLNPSVIQELLNLWLAINQSHYEVMLKTVWLNFLLWDSLLYESQEFFYSKVFASIIESKTSIVSLHLSITEFLTVIARQNNENIRYLMWPSLVILARNSFTKKAQDSLLSACFNTKSISFQIEALNALYILVSEKVHNCHLLFLRNASFQPFLQLIHSEFEDIRIWGLRYLFLINSFDEYKEMDFRECVYRACVEIDPKNMTRNTLTTLISLSFDTNMLLPTIKFTLPLISAYSHYYQEDEIDMVSNKLLNAPNLFLISKCKNWIFWIFYMINQLSLSFDSEHSLFKLIENLCVYLALNEKFKKFGKAMTFIRSLLFQMNMDMTMLISNILKSIMKSIITSMNNNIDTNKNNDENSNIPNDDSRTPNSTSRISPNLFNLVIQEVIFHLFFISKNESYSFNVQLLAKYDVQVYESVQMKFDSHQTLKSFVNIFNDIDFGPFVFSARINAKGEWIDMNLALTFIDFISLFTADKIPVLLPYQRIRTEDIFSYVASFIIRIDREGDGSQIRNVISKINKFFDNKEILESARKIIICFLNSIVCKSNKNVSQNNDNENNNNNENSTNKNNEILENDKNNDNIPFVIFGLQFTQDQRQSDFLSKWLEIFESLSQRYYEESRNAIILLWSRLTPMFSIISRETIDEFDYSLLFENHISRIFSKQKRHNLILNKITSRLLSEMKENGGPWDDHFCSIHWKYWRKTDKFYRHILMKPNKKFFDRHDNAALTRDKTLNQESSLQDENMIESQLLSKTNLLTKSLLDIDINDETSEFSNDDKNDNTKMEIISNFDADAKMITISGIYEGTFHISKKQILFTGDKISDDFGITIEESNSSNPKTKTVQLDLDDLVWVLHRSYIHIDQGLEFFLNNGLSYFFFYISQKVRSKIIQFLSSSKKLEILQDCNSMKLISDQKITEKWQNGYISTYEYLMLINFFSGRTFNDLSQYPVFPWILSDYDSKTLDLKNPLSFRDLSKPIGALNEERLAKLKREYSEITDDSLKCLYRGHYSTSYNVIHYMIRVEPFTTLHIQVQKGRFDFPSRLFTSIRKAYKTCISTANDYRELIPEFFSLSEFLVNKNNFNLGIEGGNDVVLPNWASSPSDFILKHREALESDFVGQHINDWIDLVFGYKQKGKNAVEADNTFHPYCYGDSITKKVLKDPELLLEIQQHAGSFGIIPRQVFTKKHPQRQLPNLGLLAYVTVPKFDETPTFSAVYQIDQKIHHHDNDNKNNSFLDEISINSTGFSSNKNKIVSLNLIGNDIHVLTSNQSYLILGMNDKTSQFDLLANIHVPFYFESHDSQHMSRNMTSFFKQFGVLVAISPLEDSFHAYSISDNFAFNHLFSFRQKYSSLTLISAADENTLLLLSQDGTINVWSFIRNKTNLSNSANINNISNANSNTLSGNNNNANDVNYNRNKSPADIAFNYKGREFSIIQKFRRNHHFVTTKDAFGNGNLGIIASCDVNQRIILTDIYNGSFLRSWLINGKSLFPQRVLILDSGFVAVLCETGSQNAKRTVIQCFTIDAEIAGAYDHFGFAVAWIPINFRNGTSFIAVSYEDCSFLVLHVPDLKIMMEIKFPAMITRISFNLENHRLLLSNAQGKIFVANL